MTNAVVTVARWLPATAQGSFPAGGPVETLDAGSSTRRWSLVEASITGHASFDDRSCTLP
jgi:hypothetical protein